MLIDCIWKIASMRDSTKVTLDTTLSVSKLSQVSVATPVTVD